MIASLRGQILSRNVNRLIVDVRGVGYEVAVSLYTMESLPQDGEVFLHIYTALRENSLELYGFSNQDEKCLFEMLLTVVGIGPRTSLNILSGISPAGFRDAVLNGDVHKLTLLPGIGKKSAERMLVELKEKVRKIAPLKPYSRGDAIRSSLEEDLISSLVNLGYKDRVAAEAARKVLKSATPDLEPAQAVKLALKELMK
ncbi:MAG: Holliday junction branch migration protein RuvA [Desulfomonile sp.]|jgi:Holliday junction DNA helicase RuvA|nr:Holliday junction branch migration protein RuvA [Deltaproteobacteria bacterium]